MAESVRSRNVNKEVLKTSHLSKHILNNTKTNLLPKSSLGLLFSPLTKSQSVKIQSGVAVTLKTSNRPWSNQTKKAVREGAKRIRSASSHSWYTHILRQECLTLCTHVWVECHRKFSVKRRRIEGWPLRVGWKVWPRHHLRKKLQKLLEKSQCCQR